MQNLWKIFEYGYLIIAVVFSVEAAMSWNGDRERTFLLAGFSILAVFMYFFRRRFRKKRENPNNN
jgi:membrane protein implicated in regulation of membrane protease activity